MPLFKEWNIGDTGLAAIWKVEEPEAFFNEHTGLYPDIKNDKRRIEHLAGRFLLKHLRDDFPLHLIVKDEANKPHLSNWYYHFSVSHSFPYIAAVIDTHNVAGIDIQTWNPRIRDIQHKYLSPTEQLFFNDDPQLLTMAWCAKESVYKWHGKKGIEFIEQLPIDSFEVFGDFYKITINSHLSDIRRNVLLENFINIDFACSYVINAEK